ncbi:zinc finger CCCH domain-containing protein 3 isoform X1 [Gossypium hirsutum]|uniref:Zinc finger CCCH domain-containing protein 3 isoform X1 n=1 Tax=Gossypium hirsutum TaxID=3635 RepID=A0ABM3BFQ4_GOSHI|nr:zinc finger CCCH domain-containing protein 3-like isoform X1 [Gossypium hirsutum]
MPLGKYYCDYCDKQFQDTPAARKRHLQGLQHLRAKAQWFHSQNAQDLYQTSVPPFSKGVCNRFLNTGFCQYGDNCKYFHPNNDSRTPNPPLSTAPPGFFSPSVLLIHIWLCSAMQVRMGFVYIVIGGVEGNGNGMTISWGNLPPSLKPPPEAGYPPLPFVDWG